MSTRNAIEQLMGGLAGLKELHIDRCAIEGDALKYLRAQRDLEVLVVSAPGIDDRSAPYLAELPHLRVLNLRGTGLTEASIDDLLRLSQLEELRVPFSVGLTPQLRERLSRACPKLRCFESEDGVIEFSAE